MNEEISTENEIELKDQIKDDIAKQILDQPPEDLKQSENNEDNGVIRKSLEVIRSSIEKTSNFIKEEAKVIKEVYHRFKKRDSTDSFSGAVFNCISKYFLTNVRRILFKFRVINATVGASMLSLPYVIKEAGYVVGTFLIILGSIIALVTLQYLWMGKKNLTKNSA